MAANNEMDEYVDKDTLIWLRKLYLSFPIICHGTVVIYTGNYLTKVLECEVLII